MDRLRIAVASDLHIGSCAIAPDLRPVDQRSGTKHKKRPKPSNPVEHFLDRFDQFFKPRAPVADYLIIPGDITNEATPSEFELANKVVRAIAKSIGVPVANIFFIPGNHDSDWSVLKSQPVHALRKAQRYDPFRMFGNLLLRDSKSLTESPFFSAANWGRLYVVGYNSAWHDEPNDRVHHGRAEGEHLAQIKTWILAHPPNEGAAKVFVVHHHPFQYADYLRDWDDFSVMQNAQALHDFLDEHRFDLLIHGHKHFPNLNVQTVNAGTPIVTLGAGSFCRELDSRWNGIAANQGTGRFWPLVAGFENEVAYFALG